MIKSYSLSCRLADKTPIHLLGNTRSLGAGPPRDRRIHRTLLLSKSLHKSCNSPVETREASTTEMSSAPVAVLIASFGGELVEIIWILLL